MNGNYDLTYPKESDYYDINVFNTNFSNLADGIDEIKSGGVKNAVVVASYNTTNKYKEVADYVCTKANASSVLKNAIAACNEGGVLLLLDGDYYIESTVTINKSITFCGMGCKTNIIQGTTLATYTMLTVTAAGVKIKDMTFSDNTSGTKNVSIISVKEENISIGNCSFILQRDYSANACSVLYLEIAECRILMVSNYIKKHNDSNYIVGISGVYDMKGVFMGNYVESSDDKTALVFGIGVNSSTSAAKIMYAAQNTKIYLPSGEVYNG